MTLLAQDNTAKSSQSLPAERALWGPPKNSDGEFLVALRSRLGAPGNPSGAWLSRPKLALVTACSLCLIVAVWLPGRFNEGIGLPLESADLTSMIEAVADAGISSQDLAVYLDLSTIVYEDGQELEYNIDPLSTDDLLALEDDDFNLILAELQQTHFF